MRDEDDTIKRELVEALTKEHERGWLFGIGAAFMLCLFNLSWYYHINFLDPDEIYLFSIITIHMLIAMRVIVFMLLAASLGSASGLLVAITILAYLVILGFAYTYNHYGLLVNDVINKDKTNALYFSIVTFTTLGYGDIHPTPGLRIVAAIQALLGYILMTFSVGCLTGVFLNNVNNKAYNFRMPRLEDLIEEIKKEK